MTSRSGLGFTRETLAALLIAGATVALALSFNTRSAAGADASGYVSQAMLLREGRLVVTQPLAADASWANAAWTFSPLGYRPGPDPGTIVPTYPPGLPLLLAAAGSLAGEGAMYLAVPVMAGVAVFATFLLGRALGNPGAGLLAACWIAFSPILLRQSTQVMSDVPSAAWWTLALALGYGRSVRSASASGVVAALAVLTRPNLAPLAVAVGAAVLRPRGTTRIRHAIVWALPVAIGAAAVALLHTHLYGSPLRSGYGTGDELYTLGNVATNARRYAGWLTETESVWLLAAVPAAFFGRLPRTSEGRPAATMWPLAMLSLLAVASYLPYAVFDDWWYTRFLLPAFPATLLLAAIGLTNLLRSRTWLTAIIVITLATGLVAWRTRTTIDRHDVLTLRALEQRYVLAGALVAGYAPRSVVLAAEHSGSLRIHGEVETLRWDLLSPSDLDAALAFLHARGRRPLILVDGPEEALFRARFSPSSVVGRLDWPPAAEAHSRIGVRLYDPADREVYQAGGRIETRHVFPPRR